MDRYYARNHALKAAKPGKPVLQNKIYANPFSPAGPSGIFIDHATGHLMRACCSLQETKKETRKLDLGHARFRVPGKRSDSGTRLSTPLVLYL